MAFVQKAKLWGSVVLVIGFFVAASSVAKKYEPQISDAVRQVPIIAAVPLYILIIGILTVVTPTASLPLVPVAGQLWGGLGGGLATGVGWILGGVAAFFIARRYGQEVASHLTSEDSLQKVQTYIPRGGKNLFWLLTVLEVLLPVDVLSYSAGLFTRINSATYTGAVAAGNIPSGIAFAYLGTLPLGWQLLLFAAGGMVAFVGLWWMHRRT